MAYVDVLINYETSLAEARYQMHSGELLACLSLNCLFNNIVSYSRCYLVQIKPISQKINSCVMDRRTNRQTDRHTLL